jgi:N-succinyldiaminopimelate aminotransferase
MNPRLARLHAYPFERLAQLKATVQPPPHLAPIAMSIGEPQHAPPTVVLQALERNLDRLGSYPTTVGSIELRTAAAGWLERRFALRAGSVDPHTMVLPVNGTREALFSFVQAVVDVRAAPLVLMPNPCYQIYEGAALLAGAEPYFLDATAATAFIPDLAAVPAAVWQRCQVLFLCSPGNPTGAVLTPAYLNEALALAERFDFVIAADECYAEIYSDETAAPPSLLQACIAAGRDHFERCVVFHSLSKRSSVPGLRISSRATFYIAPIMAMRCRYRRRPRARPRGTMMRTWPRTAVFIRRNSHACCPSSRRSSMSLDLPGRSICGRMSAATTRRSRAIFSRPRM